MQIGYSVLCFPDGVVLVALLLTLNIFHTFVLVFLLLTLNMHLQAGIVTPKL